MTQDRKQPTKTLDDVIAERLADPRACIASTAAATFLQIHERLAEHLEAGAMHRSEAETFGAELVLGFLASLSGGATCESLAATAEHLRQSAATRH
ncbi:MAG: hypothetical protein J7605_17255 [Variovorax sp.]|nr:hypothetical protein [Variovorax sp.]